MTVDEKNLFSLLFSEKSQITLGAQSFFPTRLNVDLLL